MALDEIPAGEQTPRVDADSPLCQANDLHFRYGESVALAGVELTASAGEIVALLGPNGSGKTTLFRLLCTLVPVQQGTIRIDGIDAARSPLAARARLGIVFQSPSLDNKLTVDENIACQAALYGIRGDQFEKRREEMLQTLQLTDRRGELCETLSGGLKRRVELAKGLLHRPRVLLLDEPSTGLDPSARLSLWDALRTMAAEGIAIILTTHLLEEADKADRVAILASGKKIAEGAPSQLRRELGEGVIMITTSDADSVEQTLRDEFALTPQRLHHQLRLQIDNPAAMVPELADRIGDRVESITIGRPSLEDVFIAKTGRSFD